MLVEHGNSPHNPRLEEEKEEQVFKCPRVIHEEFEISLERDPRLHLQMWQYSPNQVDEMGSIPNAWILSFVW